MKINLNDTSLIALIRLPVGLSAMITLGPPLEKIANDRNGEAVMRQQGEWLVISAQTKRNKGDQ